MSENKNNVEKAEIEDFEYLLKNAKSMIEKLNVQEITLKQSLEYYKQGVDSLKAAQEILENAKLTYEQYKDKD